jgi:hypothetical protein
MALRLLGTSLTPRQFVADVDIKSVVQSQLIIQLLIHPVQFMWPSERPQIEMLPLSLYVLAVKRRRRA